jgi:3-oxoacyl-[acyl-carrier protein] reductase
MDLQLTDQIAFVAGSSRGIGRAIGTALLREGCRVCITGRSEAGLESALAALEPKFGDRVFSVVGDLTQTSAIEATLETIARKWKSPDILVANIGTGSGKPGWQNDEDEWERLFSLNFFSSVRLAQSVIPRMRSSGGSILFIGSIAGLETSPAPLPYSAAKAALANYCKNLSRLVAKEEIRVNCLCPGNVLFPGGSWERHLANRRQEVDMYISTEVPQQRFGSPEEIADFAAYLLSPVSGFATGGVYVMDGGQTRSF